MRRNKQRIMKENKVKPSEEEKQKNEKYTIVVTLRAVTSIKNKMS